MSALDWHVGMKVVCVADAIYLIDGAQYPENGRIYTIRELRDDAPWGGKHIVVLLNELDNSGFIGRRGDRWTCHVEPGFATDGFRPVQTRKTSIEIFRRMLNPSKQGVDA